MKKMYPTGGYVAAQIILLILGILPGVVFFIWRLLATK